MLFRELTPFRIHGEGVLLFIRAIPRSKIEKIGSTVSDGSGQMRLKVLVHAAPTDGQANISLVRLIADELAIAPSNVQVIQGATQRDKTIYVKSREGEILQRLHQLALGT